MAYNKKTWKDRITQYPNRRTLIDTSTSQSQNVEVTRNEGTITEIGDAFNASNMNDLENRISNEFSSVNTIINNLKTNKKFLAAGTLSTTSAYGSISWIDDISEYTHLVIQTWNPSTWTCYTNTINISELSSTTTSKSITLHTTVTVSVSLTSITATYYSGSWTGMPTVVYVE